IGAYLAARLQTLAHGCRDLVDDIRLHKRVMHANDIDRLSTRLTNDPVGETICHLSLLRSMLVRTGCKPGAEAWRDARPCDHVHSAVVARWTYDQHPACAKRVFHEQIGLADEILVVRDNDTVERRSRRANPFSALNYCKRTVFLEIAPDP